MGRGRGEERVANAVCRNWRAAGQRRELAARFTDLGAACYKRKINKPRILINVFFRSCTKLKNHPSSIIIIFFFI